MIHGLDTGFLVAAGEIPIPPSEKNLRCLRTKKDKLGHRLDMERQIGGREKVHEGPRHGVSAEVC